MVSAAILLAPGCGGGAENKAAAGDPVRRASFRSLAARDFLLGCPGAAERPTRGEQLERLGELNRFAFEKGAMPSLQLAANDWAGLSRLDTRAALRAGRAGLCGGAGRFRRRLDDAGRQHRRGTAMKALPPCSRGRLGGLRRDRHRLEPRVGPFGLFLGPCLCARSPGSSR